MHSELKIIGEYGLRSKREVWKTELAVGKIRAAARHLLTLTPTDRKRVLEGAALLRRMIMMDFLPAEMQKLDYVLGLTVNKLMERRLQSKVFKLGLAKSIHHARVLIQKRHIRVGRQIVTIPSFLVRADSEKHIDFAPTSPYGGGRPGRVRRRVLRNAAQKEETEE